MKGLTAPHSAPSPAGGALSSGPSRLTPLTLQRQAPPGPYSCPAGSWTGLGRALGTDTQGQPRSHSHLFLQSLCLQSTTSHVLLFLQGISFSLFCFSWHHLFQEDLPGLPSPGSVPLPSSPCYYTSPFTSPSPSLDWKLPGD